VSSLATSQLHVTDPEELIGLFLSLYSIATEISPNRVHMPHLRLVVLTGLAILFASQPIAAAEDPAAAFLVKLYMDVCIPNAGRPENVRAWAVDKHLQTVSSPAALDLFVGAGDRGGAWAVPSVYGSFALSIRGLTQACAVWARAANPTDIETYFKKIVLGAQRPNVIVKVAKDATVMGPNGSTRLLVYSVSTGNADGGAFLYTMQTAEKVGGAFQASLQVARYTSP
jgi:hypothetical protein